MSYEEKEEREEEKEEAEEDRGVGGEDTKNTSVRLLRP